jgi:hypothetical protein
MYALKNKKYRSFELFLTKPGLIKMNYENEDYESVYSILICQKGFSFTRNKYFK